MELPHELINVGGVIIGQILHVVKKKTEEDVGASEVSILTRYILRRPINTIAAALVGAGVSIGLTPADIAQLMSPLVIFINAVIMGIAANSTINRPSNEQ